MCLFDHLFNLLFRWQPEKHGSPRTYSCAYNEIPARKTISPREIIIANLKHSIKAIIISLINSPVIRYYYSINNNNE